MKASHIKEIYGSMTLKDKLLFMELMVENSELIVFFEKKRVLYSDEEMRNPCINGETIQISVID